MKLEVAFKENGKKLEVGFCAGDKKLNMGFQNFQRVSDNKDVEYYEGNYTVVPKTQEQLLATSKKYLTEDITIKKIPYYDVSNTSGGTTVFIGKEL